MKRAPTSATRSAPLAMTMNCTTVMIRKTTRPTSTLPAMTNSPKVRTISPASAWIRMRRVVVMVSASRNTVDSRMMPGRVENSSGAHDIERHHQQQNGKAQVEADQEVDQEQRHRQNHHGDGQHQHQRDHQIRAARRAPHQFLEPFDHAGPPSRISGFIRDRSRDEVNKAKTRLVELIGKPQGMTAQQQQGRMGFGLEIRARSNGQERTKRQGRPDRPDAHRPGRGAHRRRRDSRRRPIAEARWPGAPGRSPRKRMPARTADRVPNWR